ncbi:hypothetical protein Tco_0676469 [Tanacetum coccineum]
MDVGFLFASAEVKTTREGRCTVLVFSEDELSRTHSFERSPDSQFSKVTELAVIEGAELAVIEGTKLAVIEDTELAVIEGTELAVFGSHQIRSLRIK